MRSGRRTAWSEEDYNVVISTFKRLWPDCPHGCEPQNCCYCLTRSKNNEEPCEDLRHRKRATLRPCHAIAPQSL